MARGHWFDPVVEEVRERGRVYTARFGNEIHAIFEDLRRHQHDHPERYVSKVSTVLTDGQGDSSQPAPH